MQPDDAAEPGRKPRGWGHLNEARRSRYLVAAHVSSFIVPGERKPLPSGKSRQRMCGGLRALGKFSFVSPKLFQKEKLEKKNCVFSFSNFSLHPKNLFLYFITSLCFHLAR